MSFFANMFSTGAPAAPAQSAAPAQPTPVPTEGNQPSSAAATTVATTTTAAVNPQNPLDWLMANADNNANGQTGQVPTLEIPQDTLNTVA